VLLSAGIRFARRAYPTYEAQNARLLKLTAMAERSIGMRFVEAVAARDESAIAACLAPDVEFRALLPPGLRERAGAEDAAALVAGWFADSTELDLVESRTEEVGDRLHLAYRFEGVRNGNPYIVEQHLYCTVAGGVIDRADLLCSGRRPRLRINRRA
jgi:hypothetical protein